MKTSQDLRAAVFRTTHSALESGALIPFDVTAETVRSEDGPWRIDWASSLARKDQTGIPKPGAKPTDFNPFLPYDPALHVADLGPDHVLLINKFPVKPGHVIVITRDFFEQQEALTRRDLGALATTMSGLPGLAIFNGGTTAGASLRHRHLQIAPMDAPLIEHLLPQIERSELPQQIRPLPFRHALIHFAEPWPQNQASAADRLFQAYQRALDFCGLKPGTDGTLPPYNLLATQQWLLLVPRSRETWETDGDAVSLNAIAFSGSIFVRDPALIARVKAAGLISLLRHVGVPV